MVVAPATGSECPICRAPIETNEVECPRCGERFDGIPDPHSGELESTDGARGFREKFLLYTGVALILLGGPGIALGSWLHDILHISYLNYDSFDVFGPVNRLVLGLGLIVMIVGVVFLILSLRLAHQGEPDMLD